MKKTGVFYGRFDPITDRHLNDARLFIRKHGLNRLLLVCEEEGTADGTMRYCLAKKALSPWRKMAVAGEIRGNRVKIIEFHESEEQRQESERVRNGDFSHLPKAIRKDVIESGIYGESIVRNMVNPRRYGHSLSVADLSAQLAKAHHLDSFKAYLIGLYHDIAKGLTEKQTDEYIAVSSPYESAYPEGVWHAYVGYYLLKHRYGMRDGVMLKAVRHHCLGDDRAPLSMIVYLADKLDPARGYDSSAEITLAKKDLEAAFELVHRQQADYLAGKEKE
ncbi:MAG: bis(5'-nucleosyl)-tetraphosphatase (symmetrical) YqeK [Erysipelotrichaceae bacterium]|nr:bis(5'-nucleosyl)-tetraphosphatase (symmetrical) YqeK [Erysipelotrichaceae bacterium]